MNDYEHTETLKAIKTATQMEIEGKAYYLECSENSTSDLGKKLFNSLAKEEDYHRKKFDDIYNKIRTKKSWPKSDFVPDGGSSLRTVFARALGRPEKLEAAQSEIDAVQTAIDMEASTLDFYRERLSTAKYDAEKEFYEALAGQEREHQLILNDYYEYLKDPASWYTLKEHHSMDGG
ncbi:ferritin family protein [Chloroflexota bacterium]